MAEKTVLDAAAKAVFVTSIPFYITGVVKSVQTGKQAVEVGQSMASLSPVALLQIGALVTIVQNLPDLVSKLTGTTGNVMDFMTANDIDTTEIKSQLTDF